VNNRTTASPSTGNEKPFPQSAVDLRSDTFTRPTPAMRRAMAEAEVGDDVYGEDPTVNRLEARAAELFQREAALFVPTGCMGNLISIMAWTSRTNEVICEERSHVNLYELASMCTIAGCFPRPRYAPDGVLTWELIEPLIREKIYYDSQTALICLENSHNMAGGTIYPTAQAEDICDRAHALGLRVHLDGARIFNASVALGESIANMTRKFDSVMFCLSKGLGAPVGSMVVGSREFIEKTRISRKLLGGGMRQVGVLAAAGLVALEESPEILYRDHQLARRLAEAVAKLPAVTIDPEKVVTNIVIFNVKALGKTGEQFVTDLERHGILAQTTPDKYEVRMVTHHDVDSAGVDRAIEVLQSLTKF
jgi:threonine aldolase